MIEYIIKKVSKFEKNIQKDYDLINNNSFGLSGKCSAFIQPKNLKNFIKILKICKREKINYFVLGSGTNVLVLKNGFSGIVICTKKLIKTVSHKNLIISECGTNLFTLNDFAINKCLSGLEFSYGIPGSVGGATAMNAGAFGFEMKDFITCVWAFDGKKIKKFNKQQCCFNYRQSVFGKDLVVLKTQFCLQKEIKDKIIKKCKEYFKIKKETQPYEDKSAGSVFKRVNNIAISKMIDEMGFKGETVGGAMVSTKHAGFIINKSSATSDDVLKLIEIISKRVAKVHQIDLQLEVKLLGDIDENFRRLSHTHTI